LKANAAGLQHFTFIIFFISQVIFPDSDQIHFEQPVINCATMPIAAATSS